MKSTQSPAQTAVMSSKNLELKIDWCSHEAAKYACEKWHYSRQIPAGKLAKLGVWEDEKFIGSVIFGMGANRNIGSPYGLKNTETCELVRIALTKHQSPVSKIASICLKKIKQFSPGLKLCVSYADSGQGHHGGIYQAMNWIYVGQSHSRQMRVKGKLIHKKTLASRYGREDIEWIKAHIDRIARWESVPGKHKYLYPLDRQIKSRIVQLALPYPKKLAND